MRQYLNVVGLYPTTLSLKLNDGSSFWAHLYKDADGCRDYKSITGRCLENITAELWTKANESRKIALELLKKDEKEKAAEKYLNEITDEYDNSFTREIMIEAFRAGQEWRFGDEI